MGAPAFLSSALRFVYDAQTVGLTAPLAGPLPVGLADAMHATDNLLGHSSDHLRLCLQTGSLDHLPAASLKNFNPPSFWSQLVAERRGVHFENFASASGRFRGVCQARPHAARRKGFWPNPTHRVAF
eukprot:RCo032519